MEYLQVRLPMNSLQGRTGVCVLFTKDPSVGHREKTGLTFHDAGCMFAR